MEAIHHAIQYMLWLILWWLIIMVSASVLSFLVMKFGATGLYRAQDRRTKGKYTEYGKT